MNELRLTMALLGIALLTASCATPDNTLTRAEKENGWTLLFDGETLDDWMTDRGEPASATVANGAINIHNRNAYYMLVYKEPVEDFILKVDFKTTGNSGIFFRTYSLEPRPDKDVGYNGIEMAIDNTHPNAGYHDTGAIYDLVKPTRNAMKPREWNRAIISCDANIIEVELNGECVSRMNLVEWTEPYKRPDGSSHKFDLAYRDHPRKGYIGLQDHGQDCFYKNIKLKRLAAPVTVEREQ